MFKLEKVKYKDILDIDNLRIKENIVTCILGQSGSGKTTLLRLLNNLKSPDGGTVYYNDNDILDINPVNLRREVIMLSQNPVVFDGTIRENLNLALEFKEKERVSDDILNKYLEISNLNKSLDTNAKNLSGGEKQRLSLARVLLSDGEVYLLDEPSSSLDDETERFVIKSIVDFAKNNNKTVIMVTHSVKIAEEYGKDIIRINKGSVIDDR
ncbi:ATP-binding cassette domain-containing protein [Senegalia massiliensis]|uniref:ATP-binding cassette domain-containing protein n=1 Tax=Senegalia massiliensis TaxID=1720316 RepID=A0A845QUB7_9CLOT|nr:ATP-binding cassette domain-containing protein [Senegalia massiliensis]